MSVRLSLRVLSRSKFGEIALPSRLQLRCNHNTAQLPSDAESSRSQLSKAISSRGDKLQTSLLFAGQRLNDLTGYSGIERLKNQIESQEREVSRTIERVREAKKAYEEAIRTRSESQREVNELLQRKSSWSSSDLERFTTLFRNDHSNSRNEEQSQQDLTNAEIEVDQARTTLGNMILARYHEEQIWSDKIRRASTWGTWGLMGFNIFLFVLVQLGLEPWKRKRLVGSFEEKVRHVVQEEREALQTQQNLVPITLAAELADSDNSEANTFLTDADHAAAATQHSVTSREDHTSNTGSAVLNDLPTNRSDGSEATKGFFQSPVDSSLQDRPRVGTAALWSTPMSLDFLKQVARNSYEELYRLGSNLGLQAKGLWGRALSAERSYLRVEDITSACFASGLFGIAIGLCLRR
ncbi:Sensitive to high expression protein 9 homolog, mitochondrial [Taphrina deformans PYCC 5710]|uniref:Sensitive to high expression protein 9, mitochondrial n=1 Tax=Taphrina deformans (strain PYCC 5710 / ATCC 11124 / CBS 356.35 / IMI 108563 / JCM 9778 / NBRC 8474) TaxID=1097556 RepID=R4X9X8_TAPDE|nr:Sensitive to high expression protein 9 homolog, mitochondrial [Taphrina deformans PYCC 5710]|eukprot:CCG82312.1 Sensitive to high expression protein 9 homolog, mitochondrial [Taphrina deformans PYCC 5710]